MLILKKYFRIVNYRVDNPKYNDGMYERLERLEVFVQVHTLSRKVIIFVFCVRNVNERNYYLRNFLNVNVSLCRNEIFVLLTLYIKLCNYLSRY